MKLYNVYDRVNQDRLLGQHPGWNDARATHYRFASNINVATPISGVLTAPGVSVVTLERSVKVKGWEAEVCLITDAPLRDLVMVRDFRPAYGMDGPYYTYEQHKRFAAQERFSMYDGAIGTCGLNGQRCCYAYRQ